MMRLSLRALPAILIGIVFVGAYLMLHVSRDAEAPDEHPETGAASSAEPAPMASESESATEPKPDARRAEPSFPTKPVADAVRAESGWKRAIATVFWAGEAADEDNGFIHNAASAWDDAWQERYGGYDDPECREGFRPCGFAPKENPFYVALPYNDMNEDDTRKATAARIPWNDPAARATLLKNRWIEVRVGSKSCFGQWEDVGPFGEDDADYVFGAAPGPLNTEGMRAGIDLSPAMRDCLGIGDVSEVSWRHAERSAVPEGPWLDVVTTSSENYLW